MRRRLQFVQVNDLTKAYFLNLATESRRIIVNLSQIISLPSPETKDLQAYTVLVHIGETLCLRALSGVACSA